EQLKEAALRRRQRPGRAARAYGGNETITSRCEECAQILARLRSLDQVARDAPLQRRGDGEGIELMHLAQLTGQGRWRHGVAHAQPRGVQRLTERVDRDAALAQLR